MIFSSFYYIFFIFFLVGAFFFLRREKKEAALLFSTQRLFKNINPSLRVILSRNIFLLRLLSLFIIILALMRPQLPLADSKITTQGIDIVLAIDVSTSMLARDFQFKGQSMDRLEAAKKVAREFIKNRSNDRIGLVAFAARAYMVSPLTLDYGWLMENLERLKAGMIEDATAIGLGIVACLDRLKDSKAKSKVIILLTDGRNNAGEVSPSLASSMASALGVKIYTIGAGSKGLAPYPVRDFFGNIVYKPIELDLDEDTLKMIAEKTKGKYFRAQNFTSLQSIYEEIDRLEKSPFQEKGYRQFKELFPNFLTFAFILLGLELILKETVLRVLP